jgi:hypothetical protein
MTGAESSDASVDRGLLLKLVRMLLLWYSASFRLFASALLVAATAFVFAPPVAADAPSADTFTYDDPVGAAQPASPELSRPDRSDVDLSGSIAGRNGGLVHVYANAASFVAPSRIDGATDVLKYDPDFAIGQIARGGSAPASDLVDFGASQGWRQTQTATGPIKFVDENGVTRLTIKSGSPRAPGSGSPHIEIRNAAGQRIDVYGNLLTRRSTGNHTPIIWDLGP